MNNTETKERVNLLKEGSIKSYDDLVRERERLKELLKVQRGLIQKDIATVKASFSPLINVSSFFEKLTTRESAQDGVIAAGANVTIDFIVSQLFAKSNLLVKLFLPVLLKNLSSHYLPNVVSTAKRPASKSADSPRVVSQEKVTAQTVAIQEPLK